MDLKKKGTSGSDKEKEMEPDQLIEGKSKRRKIITCLEDPDIQLFTGSYLNTMHVA